MKSFGSFALCIGIVSAALAACSGGGDDDTGGAGSGGTGTAGTGGSSAGSGGSTTGGSAGASAGSGGTTAGSGGSTAGSGGSTAGSGTAGSGGPASDAPSDTTQMGLDAFLDAGSYKTSDWVAESELPRDSEDSSPHGVVRVWFNRTLRQSQAAGDNPKVPGSMVVKELYSMADTVVGHAVMLRLSSNQWLYYCMASEAGRCTSGSAADAVHYGTATASAGCSCHGAGTIITPIPMP